MATVSSSAQAIRDGESSWSGQSGGSNDQVPECRHDVQTLEEARTESPERLRVPSALSEGYGAMRLFARSANPALSQYCLKGAVDWCSVLLRRHGPSQKVALPACTTILVSRLLEELIAAAGTYHET
eukprot:4849451-Amphidinium_carterae.1